MLDGTTNIGSLITSTSSPNTYSTTWDSTSASNAPHTLQAVTHDAAGNYATSSINIIVDNTTHSVTTTPTVTPTASYSTSGGSVSASTLAGLLAPGPATTAYLASLNHAAVTVPTALPTAPFTRYLQSGSTGQDVKRLQVFLNAHGFIVAKKGAGSPGHETTTFGPATKAALIRFQDYYADDILTPNGLSKGTGYFGSATMREVNGMNLLK